MSSPVTIKGRLTRDPELRFTKSGSPVVSFSVVTSRRWKEAEEWKEADVSFWDITAFKDLAENIANECQKGTPVIVTGAMRQEKWQNKEGENRTSWKVLADDVALSIKFKKIPTANTNSGFDEPPPF
jgi:single-strand DNA-binding protein